MEYEILKLAGTFILSAAVELMEKEYLEAVCRFNAFLKLASSDTRRKATKYAYN